MKRYLLLLIFLSGALSLRAQIVGDLSVTRRELYRRGGELHLVLDIYVAPNAVTRSQSWMIIPELSTADRQKVTVFPHVLINGKYQQHMMDRRRVLLKRLREREPHATLVADMKKAQSFSYEMTVPYAGWMDDATLVLRQIQTSPGGKQRVFTVDVNGAVDNAD